MATQPDVQHVLDTVASLDLPPIQSLSPEQARAFDLASKADRPPGPDVGEQLDGTFDTSNGPLSYRLYRPDSPGPHPVIAYWHGGGWLLGNRWTDEPLCRTLCVLSDCVVVSLDYRHAPEARFPAAADDAWDGLAWVAENSEALGGVVGRLAVAGYSAGGNLAAVNAQRATREGWPQLSAQALITPVVDTDTTTGSYVRNADGFILTAEVMKWFLDHYVDPDDRLDTRVAPLRGNVAGSPPAVVLVSEFDPLFDEGVSYAHALQAAGVAVELVIGEGQIHTSYALVDIVNSADPLRAQVAAFLRQHLER